MYTIMQLGHNHDTVYQDNKKHIQLWRVTQYNNNSTYTMLLNVSEVPEWVLQYRNIWNEVESKLF